jgi:uncharacterized HAD superfamily protein
MDKSKQKGIKMEFNQNGKREVWNIDLDGTLTNNEPFWGDSPVTPNCEMVNAIVNLYKSGNTIIIHTARQWEYAPMTVGWLITNKIPFHGLYMSKGGADHYVDDKGISVEEFKKQLTSK